MRFQRRSQMRFSAIHLYDYRMWILSSQEHKQTVSCDIPTKGQTERIRTKRMVKKKSEWKLQSTLELFPECPVSAANWKFDKRKSQAIRLQQTVFCFCLNRRRSLWQCEFICAENRFNEKLDGETISAAITHFWVQKMNSAERNTTKAQKWMGYRGKWLKVCAFHSIWIHQYNITSHGAAYYSLARMHAYRKLRYTELRIENRVRMCIENAGCQTMMFYCLYCMCVWERSIVHNSYATVTPVISIGDAFIVTSHKSYGIHIC